MATLYLGVIDQAYTDGTDATTTGDVAQWLEDRYHIMRIFAEENDQYIADQIANAVAGALESHLSGGGSKKPDLEGAMSQIQQRFKAAIDSGEIHRILPASQQVDPKTLLKNTRKKSGKSKKARAAFVDSGLYRNSFRAWIRGL